MEHDDDAVTLPRQPAGLGEQQLLVPDVERGGRLVEEEQRGGLAEHPRERRARLLPARERRVGAVGEVEHLRAAHRVGDDPVVVLLGVGPLPRRPAHPDDVDDPEAEGERLLLEEYGAVPGQPSYRPLRQRLAVQGDRAAVGPGVAGEHREQRRLARAVGPDEYRQLARCETKGDLAQDRRAAEGEADVVGDEHHAHPPAVRRVRRSSQKKTGPPTSAVSMPIGRSA